MQKFFWAFLNIYTCTYEYIEYNRTHLITRVLNCDVRETVYRLVVSGRV